MSADREEATAPEFLTNFREKGSSVISPVGELPGDDAPTAVNMAQSRHFAEVAPGRTASGGDDCLRSLVVVSKLKAVA